MRIFTALFLLLTIVVSVRAADELAAQIVLARKDQATLSLIELLRRWLDRHPDDVQSRRELVSLWLGESDFDMAESALEEWKNPDPGFAARTKAAIVRHRDNKIDAALDILRARVKEAPSDRESRIVLADTLHDVRKFCEEVTVLDHLISEKATASLLIQRAVARREIDDPAGGLSDARKALAMSPDSPSVKEINAGFDRIEKMLTEVARIDKALKAHPDSARLYFERAMWRLYGSMLQPALVDVEFGLKFQPNSMAGRILRARAQLALKQIDAAEVLMNRKVNVASPLETPELLAGIAAGDEMVAKDPKSAKAYVTRSFHLNNDSQYRLAVQDCEAAMELDPTNPNAYNNAIFASCRLQNTAMATAFEQKLEKIDPPPETLARVLGFLADLQCRNSQFAQALEYADLSLAVKPTQAIWKLKATILTRLGRTPEAEAAHKSAMEAASTDKK